MVKYTVHGHVFLRSIRNVVRNCGENYFWGVHAQLGVTGRKGVPEFMENQRLPSIQLLSSNPSWCVLVLLQGVTWAFLYLLPLRKAHRGWRWRSMSSLGFNRDA